MAITEYDFGYCKVRIHPGNLSAEEGRKVLEEATAKFAGAIERKHPGYFKKRKKEAVKHGS